MKKHVSFRLEEEVIELLRTWSFVTGKEQTQIIVEALNEYATGNPDVYNKVRKIIEEKRK
jgi:predicted DNA-binding protein